MNKCIICGKEFEPKKEYKERQTCSDECWSEYKRRTISQGFKDNMFKKGQQAWNIGKPRSEWMSEEMEKKCDKTLIHKQESCTSPLSKSEGRWLPHNTHEKGKVTKRKHVHKKGRYKGKVEWDYYINVDWKGNRKPNNLYRKYLWEVYNQQDLPKGYVVTTIDGNPDNIVIENLELITRRELLRRNTGK